MISGATRTNDIHVDFVRLLGGVGGEGRAGRRFVHWITPSFSYIWETLKLISTFNYRLACFLNFTMKN